MKSICPSLFFYVHNISFSPFSKRKQHISPLNYCIFNKHISPQNKFQFVGVEGLITSFVDTFPSLNGKKRKHIFVGIMCIIQFLIGLSMVTNVSSTLIISKFYYSSIIRIVMYDIRLYLILLNTIINIFSVPYYSYLCSSHKFDILL